MATSIWTPAVEPLAARIAGAAAADADLVVAAACSPAALGRDLSGNGNHAWFTVAVAAAGPRPETSGLLLPGASSWYGTIPDSASLDQTRITVEAWVSLRDYAANNGPYILARRETTGDKRVATLWVNTSGNPIFTCSLNGIAETSATGTTALTLNTWYRLQGTFDGSNVKVYIDGVQNGASAALVGNLFTTDRAIAIGRNAVSGSNNLNGILAAYAVSKVARSTFFLSQF